MGRGIAGAVWRGAVLTVYRTIVADPPWEQGSTGLDHGGGFKERGKFRPKAMPYRTMSLDAISALPVRDLAAPDSHLYLWTTQRFLRDSFDIAEAWGFTISATLVWCKEPNGLALGGTFASTVEFCHFARRGNLAATENVDRRWFTWPRLKGPPVKRGQSRPYQGRKPEAFLDMVERVSPGPRLEMFARRQRLGWDTWGFEALQHVEMPVNECVCRDVWGKQWNGKGTQVIERRCPTHGCNSALREQQ